MALKIRATQIKMQELAKELDAVADKIAQFLEANPEVLETDNERIEQAKWRIAGIGVEVLFACGYSLQDAIDDGFEMWDEDSDGG